MCGLVMYESMLGRRRTSKESGNSVGGLTMVRVLWILHSEVQG